MYIALISDSHDHIAHLDTALAAAKDAGAEALIHCGDLCAPFMLDRIGRQFTGPTHIIAGNNDGDGRLLERIGAQYEQIALHGVYAEVALGGHSIALIHYPEPARRIAQSGQFDLVCYGHDHARHVEEMQRGLLVNPGELLGMKGSATWALYDTSTGTCTLQSVAG